MKCKILHESAGRMRVHLNCRRMTLHQADVLEYYLRSVDGVREVSVFDRTQDAVIVYRADRAALVHALAAFSFDKAETMDLVPDHTTRKLNREFEDKLSWTVIRRVISKLFFPLPVTTALAIYHSIKYIREGLSALLHGKLSVAVLDATAVTVSNQAPSAAHWFGTDFYGRDIFSRVIWGTRIDLLIGVLGVVIPFLVGGMIGLLAGYYGGFLDSLLMRITDIMMAFPFTILVITIMAILGQGLINLFIALWLVGWMSYAKLVRSEVLVLKDSEFIQAARVAGFSDARILFRHLLPNVISSAVVFAASDVVMCMLTGASMSFLGLGVSPPTPEWGSILNEGRNFITFAWWPTLFPGLFLAVSGVGFSLLGDGQTDFLRTKGR